MAEEGWIRHSLRIGLFEFRRSVRTIRQDQARLVFMAAGVLILLLVSILSAIFAVTSSETIRSVEMLAIPDYIRAFVTLLWLFSIGTISSGIVSDGSHITAEPLMLTTVSARTVAGGLFFAQVVRILVFIGAPIIVLSITVTFIFGSVTSLVVVPIAAMLFVATAVAIGSICGYSMVLIIANISFVARHKTALGTVFAFLFTGGFYIILLSQGEMISIHIFTWPVVGWFVDLAMVGTPFDWSLSRVVGLVLSSIAFLIVAGTIIERTTVMLWYTEPVSVTGGDSSYETSTPETKSSKSSRHDALTAAVRPLVVPRFVSVSTRRVAEWTLLRTWREPNRLLYLLFPAIGIGSSLIGASLQTESPLTFALPVCAVILSWFVGAVFAINPLGDEGAVLPMTLTSVSGKKYVRGLMMPGILVGLPLVFVVTCIIGVFSPYTVGEWTTIVILSGFLTCVSVATAPAIGMALPRFSAIRVGQSRDILPPRMTAIMCHMALVMIPGSLLVMLVVAPHLVRRVLTGLLGTLPAVVVRLFMDSSGGPLSTAVVWFTHIGEVLETVESGQLQIGGGGILLIGGGLIMILLYRNAIHRFEQYSPM